MIVLLGESCSGKNTILENLLKIPDLSFIEVGREYTTRPMRDHEYGNEYHFIDDEVFDEFVSRGEFSAVFSVATKFDLWRYGIRWKDIGSRTLIITNPSNFYQLSNSDAIRSNIYSIYTRVGENERMIRMLKRGDNINEAYRRVIHDSGHFSGLENLVDLSIFVERDPEIYMEAITEFIIEAARKSGLNL
jgi:guanylate kinase